MVSNRDIQALVDRIAAEFRPRKIVLFGSYASGAAQVDSDIDLLVVRPFDGPAFRKAAEIRASLTNEFAIDIVARTPDDLQRRYRLGDPIVRHALDRGVVLCSSAA